MRAAFMAANIFKPYIPQRLSALIFNVFDLAIPSDSLYRKLL